MVAWNYKELNSDVIFLLKFTKQNYIKDMMDEGRFRFSIPEIFQEGKGLRDGQKDVWDSYKSFQADRIYVAEVISDDAFGIKHGEPMLVSNHPTRMREISYISKSTPMSCFRVVDKEDIEEKNGAYHFKLEEKIVERIKQDFGYDAYVLICYPEIFINRIQAECTCFARRIHYGEIDKEYGDFLNRFENMSQAEMFQKSKEYQWQKEFRIIIQPKYGGDGVYYTSLGSIKDIAIAGNIDQLKLGLICANKEEL